MYRMTVQKTVLETRHEVVVTGRKSGIRGRVTWVENTDDNGNGPREKGEETRWIVK